MAQGPGRFAADIERDMGAAGGQQRLDQSAARRGDVGAQTVIGQRFGDLQGGLFNAAGFQRRQQLQNT